MATAMASGQAVVQPPSELVQAPSTPSIHAPAPPSGNSALTDTSRKAQTGRTVAPDLLRAEQSADTLVPPPESLQLPFHLPATSDPTHTAHEPKDRLDYSIEALSRTLPSATSFNQLTSTTGDVPSSIL